jgi:pyridoxine 4-dehydrogenase
MICDRCPGLAQKSPVTTARAETVQYGKLGPFTVSRVGFGAMRLTGPNVFGPPRDHAEAVAVLRTAAELGINHIDTAQYYGPDVVNELIREALHPYPEDLVLVSKVGARRGPTGAVLPYDDPAELRLGIEDNLRSLGVEQLAAVNLRLLDLSVADARFDDQLAALVQARDDGLIAGVGLSNVTREHLLRALTVTEIVCVQNILNVNNQSSWDVLQECGRRGIAFVPFAPLGSGYQEPNPVLTHPGVRKVATRLRISPAQVALAWAMAISPAVLQIPGTASRKHLAENLKASDVVLDDEALRELA